MIFVYTFTFFTFCLPHWNAGSMKYMFNPVHHCIPNTYNCAWQRTGHSVKFLESVNKWSVVSSFSSFWHKWQKTEMFHYIREGLRDWQQFWNLNINSHCDCFLVHWLCQTHGLIYIIHSFYFCHYHYWNFLCTMPMNTHIFKRDIVSSCCILYTFHLLTNFFHFIFLTFVMLKTNSLIWFMHCHLE